MLSHVVLEWTNCWKYTPCWVISGTMKMESFYTCSLDFSLPVVAVEWNQLHWQIPYTCGCKMGKYPLYWILLKYNGTALCADCVLDRNTLGISCPHCSPELVWKWILAFFPHCEKHGFGKTRPLSHESLLTYTTDKIPFTTLDWCPWWSADFWQIFKYLNIF